jgi:transposase
MRRFLKVSAAVDCRSHMFVAAVTTKGPTHDVREAPRLLRQAKRNINFSTALMDAGYDAEHLHVLARERLGVMAWIPPRAGRKSRKWPKTRYRREMRKSFNKDIYKQRVQIESAFSRNKRRLGAELRARKWESQQREATLRLLTHNLMLL